MLHYMKMQGYIMGRCKVTSWEGARLHHEKVQGYIIGRYSIRLLHWKVQGYIIGREYKEKEKTPKCYGLVSIKYW